MPVPLRDRIEAAFDYRGDVTIDRTDGTCVVGYLFNRDPDREIVELYRTSDGEHMVIGYGQIADIRLTGEDHYQPYERPD